MDGKDQVGIGGEREIVRVIRERKGGMGLRQCEKSKRFESDQARAQTASTRSAVGHYDYRSLLISKLYQSHNRSLFTNTTLNHGSTLDKKTDIELSSLLLHSLSYLKGFEDFPLYSHNTNWTLLAGRVHDMTVSTVLFLDGLATVLEKLTVKIQKKREERSY